MKKHIQCVLCRHTQSEDNLAKPLSGSRNDPPLTELGIMQAERLAQTLAPLGLVALYSSDLIRVAQMSVIIGRAARLDPIYDMRLREADIGALSGISKAEARAKYPDERHQASGPRFDFSEFGGENFSQVIARYMAVFREAAGRYGTDKAADAPLICFAGHGSAIRAVMRHLGDPRDLHKQGGYQIVAL